jgi:hypothetical protein
MTATTANSYLPMPWGSGGGKVLVGVRGFEPPACLPKEVLYP